MNQLFKEIDRRSDSFREHMTQRVSRLGEFNERLDFSWIYHDNALEGTVLSFHELNAAIDERIVSDATLITTYDDIANHKRAIGYVRNMAGKRKASLGLEFLKELFNILSYESLPRSSKAPPKPTGQYRKDNPLHRLYFHEIAPPEKISYQMRKVTQWFTSDEAKRMHPVQFASLAHHRLIAIFPWPKHSGKIARLLMNALLLRSGLPPAVIHAIERQRYYETLRQSPEALTQLVGESLVSTLDSACRFLASGAELRAAS